MLARRKEKRKDVGIKFDEGRTKQRHDKKAKRSDSGTESDERTLAQRIKQKTSEPQTIIVSSSSSPDTAELDKEADML
ncbi:hypothetical protein A2U01_0078390, partial [Trifolium medium]|nr:hypothetical protein [Trifolium medium]